MIMAKIARVIVGVRMIMSEPVVRMRVAMRPEPVAVIMDEVFHLAATADRALFKDHFSLTASANAAHRLSVRRQ